MSSDSANSKKPTDAKIGGDVFQFAEESSTKQPKKSALTSESWHILVVDDQEDVHKSTLFALQGYELYGRSLYFHHAYSSREAFEILRQNAQVAVVFLDVVMETASAGLDLVARIRDELCINDTRIILRTGEPNQAPELEVIRNYDINDYRLKSDLNQSKLMVSLTAALRSYQQICTINASKNSLNFILQSSTELLMQKGVTSLAQNVLTHMATLHNVESEGVVCTRSKSETNMADFTVVAASGRFLPLLSASFDGLGKPYQTMLSLVARSADDKVNIYDDAGLAMYLGSTIRGDMICFLENEGGLRRVDRGMVELSCSNVSLCADNIHFLDRLKTYAFTDALVGLPNRNALEEIIDDYRATKTDVPYSLAIIDIDNFAETNVVLGQEYGDQLLRAASERLKSRFYSPSTVARIGSDIFAVFGPTSHIDSKPLLQPFLNPFQIGGELQTVSVTAGIVPLQEVEGGGAEAIKDASIVLKQAKNGNRGQVLMFHQEMVSTAQSRLEMLKDLRQAFELNQLFLVFQPKLRLDNLAVTGFEALLRWRNSDGKFISPAEFIPLAEQSGLIIRMGEWILRNAIAQLAILRSKGYVDCTMAVNLSVAQIEHPDIMEMLKRVMGESNIPASSIDLEITESVAMGDINQTLERLNKIRELGFKLSMDDFGTGFSSLTYLQKMPINCLKVDRAFVNTCDTKSGREIVEMIIQLGKTLELKVVAEGVETQEQGLLLKDMGCHEVQGFYYARPMPQAELHQWLSSYLRKS